MLSLVMIAEFVAMIIGAYIVLSIPFTFGVILKWAVVACGAYVTIKIGKITFGR